MPAIVTLPCHWRRKAHTNKHEYQPLEVPEYAVNEQPAIKVSLCCLFVIQLIVLTLWILAIVRRSQDGGNVISLDKSSLNKENLIFVQADVFEDYNNELPEWEGKNEDPYTKCVIDDDEKFDCHPESGVNELSCRSRGCCWLSQESTTIKYPKKVGVPWCFYPKNYGGYRLVNVTQTKNSVRAFFARTFPSPYPDDVKLMRMDVQYQNQHRIHVKIVDAESERYEPPYPEIPVVSESNVKEYAYQFMLNFNGFKILRNDQAVILDCENVGGFIFADQFLQISFKFWGKIYGLGEHDSSLQLNTNWTKFTLFNRDGIPKPETNLYGSQPFYLVIEPSGKSHGVFFHNSNAMDILLQPSPALTFRSIGGVFDFYIFLGPTPADVVKQYTETVGGPFMPPYWSLGFHLSRFGYKNTSHIREVWRRTRAAGIPFDTQWHDIDYMERRNDFTYDKKAYADLPKFVKEIHEAGMHYVPILDPGISGCEPNGTYPPYDEGLAMDIFVKNWHFGVFRGKVWNSNCTVFPDFTSVNTVSYWSRQIRKFHNLIPFDGIWIDMNEPSNFLDGTLHGCPASKWDFPPFTPGVGGGKLYSLTLCMSARHAAGLHYDVHNLYGLSEAKATFSALQLLRKRPFIISRSTYAGIGKYAGHWSGDIEATWDAMKQTIPKMLSFSLFGVPMMGADICGFNGNTTEVLCQRWSQLGAFYPFSRNHNSDDCIDQDPVALGKGVVKSAKKALLVRYTLLPYLYTLFYKAHVFGETVARPLFLEFWHDHRTHNLDKSFLWGCCILIVPVLEEYATTVQTYFPAGRWYDWYTGLGTDSNGTEIVIHAPSDTIPVFIRGGVVLPTQTPDVTTTLSRMNDIELLAAYNKSLFGSGMLYWDDGESFDVRSRGEYGIVHFSLTPNNLTSDVKFWGYHKVPQLSSIKILGFVKPIEAIYINKMKLTFNWNSTTLILTIELKHPMNVPFVLEWTCIGD